MATEFVRQEGYIRSLGQGEYGESVEVEGGVVLGQGHTGQGPPESHAVSEDEQQEVTCYLTSSRRWRNPCARLRSPASMGITQASLWRCGVSVDWCSAIAGRSTMAS
jgi:hypothetical protein